MAHRKVHTTPFALSSDGKILLNLATVAGDDVARLLQQASDDDRPLFVGVVLDSAAAEKLLARLDNAGAEAAAVLEAPARTPATPSTRRRTRPSSTNARTRTRKR